MMMMPKTMLCEYESFKMYIPLSEVTAYAGGWTTRQAYPRAETGQKGFQRVILHFFHILLTFSLQSLKPVHKFFLGVFVFC